MARARRSRLRLWPGFARRALVVSCVWLVIGVAGARAQSLPSDALVAARYDAPTDRYAHGVLGDAIEWGALVLIPVRGPEVTFRLPTSHVFEDLEPRLVDLDLDGHADAAMVVETDRGRGAALALYGITGKIVETPHIGRSNRWLAPIGAADLDGDGHVEIACIDRPHLAKTLRIWRFRAGWLERVAEVEGLTNHRIGEDFISGGIRDCGAGPEMITADAGWRRIMASRLENGQITSRAISDFDGPASFPAALACE